MSKLTLQETRELFVAKHDEALALISTLVSTPDVTNNEWAELVIARRKEIEAAKDVMTINQIISDVERISDPTKPSASHQFINSN